MYHGRERGKGMLVVLFQSKVACRMWLVMLSGCQPSSLRHRNEALGARVSRQVMNDKVEGFLRVSNLAIERRASDVSIHIFGASGTVVLKVRIESLPPCLRSILLFESS